MLPLRARVDLEAMAEAPALQEPPYQIVWCHIQDTLGGSYLSAEMQSVYSAVPFLISGGQASKMFDWEPSNLVSG